MNASMRIGRLPATTHVSGEENGRSSELIESSDVFRAME